MSSKAVSWRVRRLRIAVRIPVSTLDFMVDVCARWGFGKVRAITEFRG